MKDNLSINNLATIGNLCGYSFAHYSEKCFTQIYRAFYGDTMFVPLGGTPTWFS